jgi:hypothetical protein
MPQQRKGEFTMSKSVQERELPLTEAKSWSRRAIFPLAGVFFALQIIGTVIAIAYKMPYEVGGQGGPNNVARDFLTGGGTALSGPLAVLVLLAVLIGLGHRQGRLGNLALVGTVFLGALATVFGAQEPIAMRMLQAASFGLFEAVVVALAWGSIIVSALLVVLSLVIFTRRVRQATVFGRRPPSSQSL